MGKRSKPCRFNVSRNTIFSFAFDFMPALTLCQCHFRKISFACSSKISISCRSCSVIALTAFRLIDVRGTSICPVFVIARSKVKISSFSIFYQLSKVIRSLCGMVLSHAQKSQDVLPKLSIAPSMAGLNPSCSTNINFILSPLPLERPALPLLLLFHRKHKSRRTFHSSIAHRAV